MANTLYDYYNQKGSRLGSTVDQRFSDPEFSSAAQRAGITKDSYSINQGNGSYNQRILAELSKGNTPVQTQTPSVVNPNTTTVQDLMNQSNYTAPKVDYSNPDFTSNYVNDYSDTTNPYYNDANINVNESSIYNSTLDRFKGELDSLRNVYNDTISKARVAGQGNLGSNRAIQARSGLLGSSFGEAQTADINTSNADQENAITNQYTLNVQRILSGARADAQKEVDDKKEAKRLGVKEYLDFNKGKEDRRDVNLKKVIASMITNGDDPSRYSPMDIKKISTALGIASPTTLISEYNAQKGMYDQAQEKNRLEQEALDNKNRYMSLSDGSQLIDSQTGEVVADNMKSIAPKKSTLGSNSSNSSTISDISSGVYSNDLDAIIGNTMATIGSKYGLDQFKTQLSKVRNDADRISLVASTVLKNSPSEVRNAFADQSRAVSNIDKAIAEIDKGAKTGLINSKLQKGFNLVGKDYDPTLSSIASYITAAIQPYRSNVTGAAWGSQEEAEYAQLFGSTAYSPTELKNRLSRLKEIMRDNTAQGLNVYVNPTGTYDNVFTSKGETPQGVTLPSNSVTIYSVKTGEPAVITKDKVQQALSTGLFRQ